jgi:hypothetical protein
MALTTPTLLPVASLPHLVLRTIMLLFFSLMRCEQIGEWN